MSWVRVPSAAPGQRPADAGRACLAGGWGDSKPRQKQRRPGRPQREGSSGAFAAPGGRGQPLAGFESHQPPQIEKPPGTGGFSIWNARTRTHPGHAGRGRDPASSGTAETARGAVGSGTGRPRSGMRFESPPDGSRIPVGGRLVWLGPTPVTQSVAGIQRRVGPRRQRGALSGAGPADRAAGCGSSPRPGGSRIPVCGRLVGPEPAPVTQGVAGIQRRAEPANRTAGCGSRPPSGQARMPGGGRPSSSHQPFPGC